MESDDDIRYTLMGLLIIEKHGRDFTWRDVAWLWENQFPMAQLCTAECQAALNYNLCGGRQNKPAWDIDRIRCFNNPYREWIGAQIRADFFGWACAGNPELAAEFAWRDASWTHVKNGIYGEMFMAAVEAAAFVESNPVRLVEIGLGEIPRNCRLAAALRKALAEIPKHDGMESFMAYMDDEFGTMSSVHTINNAVLCAAALIYGKMNPDACVCEAVTGGLDTDCNGATVGAIAGIVARAPLLRRYARRPAERHDQSRVRRVPVRGDGFTRRADPAGIQKREREPVTPENGNGCARRT